MAECPKCTEREKVRAGCTEVYQIETEEDVIYTFDVGKAKETIATGDRKAGPIPSDAVDRFRYVNTFVEEHLSHVACDEPGIVACLDEGNEIKVFLIDGNHRLEKAVRAGTPPTAFVLSPPESQECLVGKRFAT
jgi:hypothetical protein